MRKLLFLSLFLILVSCDFKDKGGNAPLIEDANGNLIDNPNYKSDAEYEKIEADDKWDEDVNKIHDGMKAWADSVAEADEDKVYTDQELKEKKEKIERVKRNFNLK